jgi:hypothetical protein
MAAKRLFPIVLALLMGVSFATPSGARAVEFQDGGLRYETETTIGASPVTTAKVIGCVNTCPDNAVIPDTAGGYSVTKIGYNAFRSSPTKTVVIGNSVTLVDELAFANSPSLTSVTFGTSVQIIGAYAFYQTGLTSLILPNTVTSIGVNSFNGTQLTSVTLSNSLTTITDGAFGGTKFTSVSIPSSVTSIGGFAFAGSALTSLAIPNTVTSIGDSAFRNSALTSVTIPNSITSIGRDVFREAKLTSVTIPNSVTSIGDEAFQGNLLTAVTIPNSVTSFGNSVFDRNRLTSVTLPSGMTTIPIGLFANNLLTNVTIPNTVTSISNGAFVRNELTNVTIPNTVTSIGHNAFEANKLTEVTIPNSVTYIGIASFNNNLITNLTIGNSVTTILQGAFQLNHLSTLEIPNSVTTIGNSAFGFNSLTSVLIGSGVTSIGDQAFWSNNQLQVVTFAGDAPTAGSSVFLYTGDNFPEVKRFYSRTGWSETWSGKPVVTTVETTAKPYMSGIVAVGNTITGNLGGWDGPATPTLAAQWYACTAAIPQETQVVPSTCSAISDATASAFTVTAAESDKFIAVGVTASSAGATSATWLSSTFAHVAPANTAAPVATETVDNTSTFTASTGTWTGYPTPTYAYQWFRCTAAGAAADTLPSGCTTIAGANQATYATDAADYQKFLRVQVTTTNTLGSATTYSAATANSLVLPANTAAPAVTGTASVFSTLTASNGTWTGIPAPTYAYQWLRCTAAGAAANTLPSGCTTIAGATQATYATDTPDDQKFLRVQVTTTNTLGSATRFSAATAKIAAFNTVAPAVTGTASVFSTLTASSGTWTGSPLPTYTYQWLRCTAAGTAASTLPAGCTTIAGATQATYPIDTLDYQKFLRVRVTGTNTLGSATRYTAATAKIAGRITVNTVAPTITGTTTINATLTGARGTWTGAPVPTYTYQWLRCTRAGSASDALPSGCSTISGATRTTYKLTTTDYGKYLRLRIVGTNALGADTKYSAATAKIAGTDPVNTVAPRITGTPRVGSTVTGTEGTWTGFPDPTSRYQWFRCTSAGSASVAQPSGCTAISGATRSTYKLVAADKTSGYLRVRVTGSSAEGSAVRFSAAVKVQ